MKSTCTDGNAKASIFIEVEGWSLLDSILQVLSFSENLQDRLHELPGVIEICWAGVCGNYVVVEANSIDELSALVFCTKQQINQLFADYCFCTDDSLEPAMRQLFWDYLGPDLDAAHDADVFFYHGRWHGHVFTLEDETIVNVYEFHDDEIGIDIRKTG